MSETDDFRRPGSSPLDGPLAVGEIRWDDWRGRNEDRLLYASLDLMERDELRRKLGLPSRDQGPEDVSLVRAAYRRWRAEAARRLGGQFVFAMWDGQRQAVVAARDSLGLRPFFFARTPTGLAFGGSLRALLARETVPEQYDERMAVVSLLERDISPLNRLGRTWYKGVDALKPGHVLSVDPEHADYTKYWEPKETPPLRFRKPEDYAAALRELLLRVIAEHADDETLGAHLSRGIDSSSIVALASCHRREAGLSPPICFSWQPPPGKKPEPEHELIGSVAESCRSPLVYSSLTREDVLALLRRDGTRDPQQTTIYETFILQQASERGVSTILSGWGGDQAISFVWPELVLPHLLWTGQWKALWNTVRGEPRGWRGLRSALRGAPRLQLKSLERRRQEILIEGKESFLRTELLERTQFPILEEPRPTPHDWMSYILTDGSVTARTDAWAQIGAAKGIRYRYPLLDRRVIDFALGAPPEVWARREGLNRWLLRRALAGLLPDPVRLGNYKRDPLCAQNMKRRWREGVSEVSAQIRSQLEQQPLAEFLDLKRLSAALQPERLAQRQRWGPLSCVLANMSFEL